MYLGYCDQHDPEKAQNKVSCREKKYKEEIVKFLKICKPFVQEIRHDLMKKQTRETDVKQVRKIGSEKKQAKKWNIDSITLEILQCVKDEIKQKPDCMTRISLKKDCERNEVVVSEVREDRRMLFDYYFSQESPIIQAVSHKINISAKKVLEYFCSFQMHFRKTDYKIILPDVELKRKSCNHCRKIKDIPIKVCSQCKRTFHIVCMVED